MYFFQSQMSKKLKGYLERQGRIDKQLDQLARLSKNNSNDKSLLTLVKSKTKCKDIFKILILLNKLIMTNTIKVAYCRTVLSHIKIKGNTQMQLKIINKGLNPYLTYLQRRNEQRSLKVDQSSDHQEMMNHMFKLINLINLASSFSGIFYTLGRYCQKQYPFGIDFNMILGTDIKIIYDILKKVSKKVKMDFGVREDIEGMHQKMFLLYYNCYYGVHLDKLDIDWIQTQQHYQKEDKNEQQKNDLIAEKPILQDYFQIFDLCNYKHSKNLDNTAKNSLNSSPQLQNQLSSQTHNSINTKQTKYQQYFSSPYLFLQNQKTELQQDQILSIQISQFNQ